jgi:glucosamine--fructose-6-phosphate aminotransferase (isomerizing)
MCGVVGYVGQRDASEVVMEGLSRLEYRGYDSAGIAVHNCAGIALRKRAGRLKQLRDLVAQEPARGNCGIGHTRWATHGAPNTDNAHPHVDCTGRIAVVHNGIIENADLLRARLESRGHRFTTATDTEVLAHLIEDAGGPNLESRVAVALRHVEGTYGIAVIAEGEEGKIVAARRGSPVLLGVGNGEFFVASDASAVRSYTRSVVYLNDGDIATVTSDGYRVLDHEARDQARIVADLSWDISEIDRGGYAHFMRKEIGEQAETVRNVLRGRLLHDEGTSRLNGLGLSPSECRNIKRIVIVGCGSSWHAGLVGRHYIEEIAGIPVEVEYASEFRYRRPLAMPGTLTIAISQSGETADTLEAMRAAKEGGSRVIGIVNVVDSTIARETDGGMYLHAGPEIGVASTKAFTAQLVALMMFALYVGRFRDVSQADGAQIVGQIAGLPDLVSRALACEDAVKVVAEAYAEREHVLYLGRGVHFPVALEGALKLKEISYVHAEGYPAAEMKHGPIALIDANMPVVFIAPNDRAYPKVMSNMAEVKARGGQIIALTSEGNGDLRDIAAHQLRLPACTPLVMPVVASIPLQLLAYHIAVLRGCDVDQPRNLAKSVTVE